VAEQLLRAEGFTDVLYVDLPRPGAVADAIAGGTADFGMIYCPPFIAAIDAGHRFRMLAGVHVGCFELFASPTIRSIVDLKGKRFAMAGLQGPAQLLMSAMAAYVGLDPASDIGWIVSRSPRPIELFINGKVDAFIAFQPEPQDLRALGF